MATTGTEIFNAAMALSDDLADTTDYTARSIYIINMLSQQLYPYSDTLVSVAGSRPVFTKIIALTDIVNLDDALAIEVLPHGLVAMLFANEKTDLANFHMNLYNEKKNEAKNYPQAFEAIEDMYGALNYSEYAE